MPEIRLFTADQVLSSDELNDEASIEAILQAAASEPGNPENELPAEEDELATEPVWDPDPIESMRRLEAVLFLSKSPLTSRKLSQLAGLEDGTQARTMVKALNQHYDQVGRSFHVKRVAGDTSF